MGINYGNFVLDVALKARIRNMHLWACVCVGVWIHIQLSTCSSRWAWNGLFACRNSGLVFVMCIACFGSRAYHSANRAGTNICTETHISSPLDVIYPPCISLCWHLCVPVLIHEPNEEEIESNKTSNILIEPFKTSNSENSYLIWHFFIVPVHLGVVNLSATSKRGRFGGSETDRDVFSHKQILSPARLLPSSPGKSPTGEKEKMFSFCSSAALPPLSLPPLSTCALLSLFLQPSNNLPICCNQTFPLSPPLPLLFRTPHSYPSFIWLCAILSLPLRQHRFPLPLYAFPSLLRQSQPHHPFHRPHYPPDSHLGFSPVSPAELQQGVIDQLNRRR